LLIGDPPLRLSLTMEPYSTRIEDHGSQKTPHKPPIAGWMWNAEKAGVASPAQRLFVFDMVEQWRSMTGLPAVLAVWAARKGVATPEVVADFHASAISVCCASSKSVPSRARIGIAGRQARIVPARQPSIFSLDEENRRGLEPVFHPRRKTRPDPQAKPIAWRAWTL